MWGRTSSQGRVLVMEAARGTDTQLCPLTPWQAAGSWTPWRPLFLHLWDSPTGSPQPAIGSSKILPITLSFFFSKLYYFGVNRGKKIAPPKIWGLAFIWWSFWALNPGRQSLHVSERLLQRGKGGARYTGVWATKSRQSELQKIIVS